MQDSAPASQRLQRPRSAPPGLELVVWRQLPTIALWGTLLPLTVIAVLRLSGADNPEAAELRARQLGEYALIGGMFALWTLLFTVAVGCVVVRVMKGPAYSSTDPYPLPERPRDDERRG
jgi:hypothetical protein